MRDLDGAKACATGLSDDRMFSRDSLDRALLDVAVRAARGQDCDGLDRVPVLGRHAGLAGLTRRAALIADAWADAIPAEAAETLDAESVAAWIVDRYPAGAYRNVVLGPAHGGGVHLAAALDAVWLPIGFTVQVQWPDGAAGDWHGALQHGTPVAERILAANGAVTVRQVHDPVRRGVLSGVTLTLHVRWRRLPQAYREFLGTRLAPDAATLLLRDTRTWPVLSVRPGYSFQVGSPVSGWQARDYSAANPSYANLLRRLDGGPWLPVEGQRHRFAELTSEAALESDVRAVVPLCHRVMYPSPSVLSAGVADVYRQWAQADGRGGHRCVLETERLIDPWTVRSAGLVPYWMEGASAAALTGAEAWIAGHEPFAYLDVLPQPPGTVCDAHAGPTQWRVPAWFATVDGRLDREAMRRYPMLPLASSHATAMLRARAAPVMPAAPLSTADVLAGLRRSGETLGMKVG